MCDLYRAKYSALFVCCYHEQNNLIQISYALFKLLINIHYYYLKEFFLLSFYVFYEVKTIVIHYF